MATNASIGYGTIFQRGDGADPETFTPVGEVINELPWDMTKDVVDATHHGSPNRYREKISGLRDAGEIVIEVNHVPGGTAFTDALSDFNDDVARNYKIVWSDTSELEFSGILSNLSVTSPLDDKMVASLTYTLASEPTYTAAA